MSMSSMKPMPKTDGGYSPAEAPIIAGRYTVIFTEKPYAILLDGKPWMQGHKGTVVEALIHKILELR